MRQLWGTFSLRAHCVPRPFVADVVLYDKLVVPVPPDPKSEPGVLEYWDQHDLQPGRQRKLLDVLKEKDLVVEVPWDKQRRAIFKQNYAAAQAAEHETVNGWSMTEHQLYSDERIEALGKMEVRPKVVASYRSLESLKEELPIGLLGETEPGDAQTRQQELAIMLGHELVVPAEAGPPSEDLDIELLRRAAKLASGPTFKEKRAEFRYWLEKAVAEGYTRKEALGEMRQSLAEYGEEVKRAGGKTRIELAFLIAGTGLTVAGHFFPPLWVGAVLLAPVKYATLKSLPDGPFTNRPAAMFHDARAAFSQRPWWRVLAG